jgi:aryl-alcohol dehydrogenase-like predicted oxidoreductase
MKKLARQKGCTTSQLALAWVLSQGLIPIVGTTKAARLEENWGCRDVTFSKEELTEMRRIVEEAKPEGERFSRIHQEMVGH